MQRCWPRWPIPPCRPIDQNSAIFFERVVVDEHYGGIAFEEEGERCSKLFADPKVKVMVMGNHGVMVIGDTPADTFDRLYYFERACETYIKALWTGKPLRRLSDEVARTVARQIDEYPLAAASRHLQELKAILDEEGSNLQRSEATAALPPLDGEVGLDPARNRVGCSMQFSPPASIGFRFARRSTRPAPSRGGWAGPSSGHAAPDLLGAAHHQLQLAASGRRR